MLKYEDNAIARINGNNLQPLAGVSVTVTDKVTGLPASLYADDGTTPLAQPLVTNDNGYYGFKAPDGTYVLTFSGQRIATFTREIVLDDPKDNPYVTVAGLAAGTGAAGVGYNGRTVADKLGEFVSVKDAPYNAKGDGITDDTAAIQAAINAGSARVPPGVYIADQITMPSNRTLYVDYGAILRRKSNAASDSSMIVNASGAAGDSNIIITGPGELDGNAANQTGDRQGLVRFQKPTDCSISVRRAGNNKYGSGNPVLAGQGCIVFIDGVRCKAHDIRLNLWQREGIYFDGATAESTIQRITAVGDGLNSWTACSISGVGAIGNKLLDITVNNAGASSVGCDSTYSQVDNIISRNNQFNNGVNFGHQGKPATGSRASNITVINAGQGATSGSTHCGVQVGGGTTDFDLTNVTVSGAYNHCIQVSDGASDVQIKGANRLTGSLHGSGINVFGADKVRISGVKARGNSDYGINLNASNDCSVDSSDLRGNTINAFSASGSRITVRNTPGSDDAVAAVVALTGLAAGASVTVNNNNVFGFYSAINLFHRNAAVVAAQPYISAKSTGSFTITVVNAVPATGGPHNLSCEIL